VGLELKTYSPALVVVVDAGLDETAAFIGLVGALAGPRRNSCRPGLGGLYWDRRCGL